MRIEDFERIARAAIRQFPTSERYGTLENNAAMNALVDAGFTSRPNWELVEKLRDAFASTTNPVGMVIALDEIYYWYFGRGYVQPEPKPGVATAA